MIHYLTDIERTARSVERHAKLAPPNYLLQEAINDLLHQIHLAMDCARRDAAREAEYRERMVVAESENERRRA